VVLSVKRAVSDSAALNLPCSRLLTRVTGYLALEKKLLTPVWMGCGTAAL
jgi:hypothetical protein